MDPKTGKFYRTLHRPPEVPGHDRSKGMSSDLVAVWEVSLSDGVHKVEFEHGTTSGKRIIRVDNKEVRREDWMFKLVGKEHFKIGKVSCCIGVEAVSGFAYEYSLEVNGKPLNKFSENQSKIMKTWTTTIQGVPTRIVLERDTLDVWVNGQVVPTTGEFVDDGTETHFTIADKPAFIHAVSSGKRREGIIHHLYLDQTIIAEARE